MATAPGIARPKRSRSWHDGASPPGWLITGDWKKKCFNGRTRDEFGNGTIRKITFLLFRRIPCSTRSFVEQRLWNMADINGNFRIVPNVGVVLFRAIFFGDIRTHSPEV